MAAAKVSTEEVIEAYRATGSVWKAGKRVGLSGQTVHDRLVAVGYPRAARHWTAEERTELARLRADGVPLGQIARALGRPYGSCATVASNLKMPRGPKPAKIPRGAGFDKVSMTKHMVALECFDGPLRQYVKSHGLWIEPFVGACQRHFPERWQSYVESRSDLPQKTCEYCERTFIPSNAKQRFCVRQCATDARTDRDYFGGKRRSTVGLAEGVCQCCGVHRTSRLAAHHVLGHENDPEHGSLVALCPGCHNVVTALGGRIAASDPAFWESLISLVWLRKFGADCNDEVLYVCVDIDTGPDEDADRG